MRVYIVRKWPLWGRSRFVCWFITRVGLWLLWNVHFVQSIRPTIATWPRWPKGTDHCSSEEYRCTHVDVCVARTWISYRCVRCHRWCTQRTSPVVKKKKPFFSFHVAVNNSIKSYVYRTVQLCDIWRIRDQHDVTSYFYFTSYVQHVSDINTSIIRSLRLFCWITTLAVLFLFRCVLEFRCGWVGVVSVLQASACNTDTTPTQPHRNSNTHRNKNTQPMWWYNRKVAGSWW